MSIIKDNTSAVLREVDKRIVENLNELSSNVQTEAERIVHVKTGKLQRSIIKRVFRRKAVIGSPVKYAPFVEMRFPYLRPALEATMAKIRMIFGVK